jgi:hypothetical protein
MFLKKRAGKYTKAPSEVYTKVNQPKSVEKKINLVPISTYK